MEARAWMVKLRGGEMSSRMTAEFDRWRLASPENAAAYEREVADYAAMREIKTLDDFGLNGTWRERPGMGWRKYGTMAAGAIAVLFIISVGINPLNRHERGPDAPSLAFEPFSTQRGEIRILRLSDGSIATLDTDSMVEVSITNKHRQLRLSQGRARITVAKGALPFSTRAGAGEIIAYSGSFDVAYDSERHIGIRVLEGDALVQPSAQFAALGAASRRLVPGSTFVYRAADFTDITKAQMPDIDLNQDWPRGWVEFESIRLDRLIEQANKYSSKPIRLADPTLATLNVSGRFKISDTEGFVARICDLFDLRSTSKPDAIIVRR
jgi:transmembrane sensor